MERNLKKELRSWNREVRNSVMDYLAEVGDKESIHILKHIARGGSRFFIFNYDARDQEYALDKLADTDNISALGFVSQFYSTETIEIPLGYEIPIDTGGGINAQSPTKKAVRTITTYPYATGALGRWLNSED